MYVYMIISIYIYIEREREIDLCIYIYIYVVLFMTFRSAWTNSAARAVGSASPSTSGRPTRPALYYYYNIIYYTIIHYAML